MYVPETTCSVIKVYKSSLLYKREITAAGVGRLCRLPWTLFCWGHLAASFTEC